ncbi:MAG: NAD-dependent epimerase/dehydratase family protein, partial [Erysipelotrichia bacterium]|nr:NAD-dependent epimerase/dehydratase family protein [Erysipelotrichia bacterium]
MKVLLTGSTGYIGRRLKQILLNDENIELKLLVRNKKSVTTLDKNVTVIQGDTFDKESLKEALKDVEVAYYLIHSLSNENYKDLDKISAQNFLDVANECGVK